MTYFFKGFFTKSSDDSIINEAKKKWEQLRIKKINSPFKGIVIAGPDIMDFYHSGQELFKKAEQIGNDIENELPEWSKKFKEETFVFIHVDCWCGDCEYSGHMCKNGEILFKTKKSDDDTIKSIDIKNKENDKNLRELVDFLGVKLNEKGYFEPFTRGFFE